MTALLALDMFIRTVYKKNKKSSTKYECQQLVESIRTEKGVRQKLLLSLGRLPIPKEKWPTLTKRIEAIVQGQKALFKTESEIEDLAQKFAQQFIDKHDNVSQKDDIIHFEEIIDRNEAYNQAMELVKYIFDRLNPEEYQFNSSPSLPESDNENIV